MLGAIPAHAIYFSIYEIAKEKLGVDSEEVTPLLSSLVGVICVCYEDLCLTPFDGNYFDMKFNFKSY